MLAHLDMPTLLRRWSEEALLHAADIGLVVTPAMHDGWIGGPPATDADIAAAEHRLGAALPPSYRAFLSVSNGWPVTWLGFGALRATTGIGWLRDLDPVALASSPDTSHAPAFDTAVQQARTLTRAGNDDAALDRVLTALPHWQPRSPAHLAPVGLLADRDTAHLFTPEHRPQLLTTPRAIAT